MKRNNLHKKITLFVTSILCGYSLIDMMYGAVYILLMSQSGLDLYRISIVFSVMSFFTALFDYPSGNVSDLLGRKKITSIGFIIWGVGLICFAKSTTFIAYIVAVIVMVLGIASISGSPQAWYIDKLKSLNKLDYKDQALPRIQSIRLLFSALGAALATILIKWNLAFPLVIGGALAIVIGVATLLIFEDNYGERTEDHIVREVIHSTKQFLQNINMKKLLIYNLLKGIPFLVFIISWQLYAVKSFELRQELIGTILIGFMLIMSFAGYLSSLVVQKLSSFKLSTIGLAVGSIGLLGIFLSGHIIFLLVSFGIYEFGLSIEISNTGSWIQDLIPSGKRATFYSGLSALQSLFNSIIVIGLGYITNVIGYRYIWLVACIIQVFALLFVCRHFIVNNNDKISMDNS